MVQGFASAPIVPLSTAVGVLVIFKISIAQLLTYVKSKFASMARDPSPFRRLTDTLCRRGDRGAGGEGALVCRGFRRSQRAIWGIVFESSTIRKLIGSLNTTAIGGIYSKFPVTGATSQTPNERKPLAGGGKALHRMVQGEGLSFLHK